MFAEAVAVICLSWYCGILVVTGVGILQLVRWYSAPPRPSISAARHDDAPHVTIIRPVKGIDASLYDCLASTFLQDYPAHRRSVCFCVDRETDPAVPVLRRLIADFAQLDARLYIETLDEVLQRVGGGGGGGGGLGPNPKIRSMSRAYREAKGDVVWIVDCNVWVNRSTCGRLVDTLLGYVQRPNKFVHQLPLVVDDTSLRTSLQERSKVRRVLDLMGGRFEEAWFSGAHAKFYTAINTVLVAPCIVGKSNMFRKSHLNALTNGRGIDYFSHNICEDHLIGDLLWKQPIPPNILQAARSDPAASQKPWGNHALDFGNPAIQPVVRMSISEFFHRRVRWLRVRKYTVMAATLVEPGTESILCSVYGSYAVSTLPYFERVWHIPPTWLTFFAVFLVSMTGWAVVDWALYCHLQSGASIQQDGSTFVPKFACFKKRRPFRDWLVAWLARESLALPIWLWAVYGGATVGWRGKHFRVGIDMRVREIEDAKANGAVAKTD